jgi:hypothetical protein
LAILTASSTGFSTTLSTKLHTKASSAPTFRPFKTNSVALPRPIFLTRRGWVPPRSERPTLRSGREIKAEGEQNTILQLIRASTPPPTTKPFTAARIGFLPCREEVPQKPVGGKFLFWYLGVLIHSLESQSQRWI